MSIYYVKTNGSDNQSGLSDASAWATWNKAFTSTTVNAGDTVYFRGGVYSPSTGDGYSITRSGTAGNYINYFNYPGEEPILDWDNVTLSPDSDGIVISSKTDIHFKGLTLRNINQTRSGTERKAYGWGFVYANRILVENCKAYNCEGSGFASWFSYNVTYLNCDAWNCVDTYGNYPGQNGYGFWHWNSLTFQSYIYHINCRAWVCSDDAFQSSRSGDVEYDGCWAFSNGPPTAGLQGDGNGIKLSFDYAEDSSSLRLVKNCLFAHNKHYAIGTNDSSAEGCYTLNYHIYNNTFYKNAQGLIILNSLSTPAYEASARLYRNNIAYNNTTDVLLGGGAIYTHDHNTWDSSITVTDADFLSILSDPSDCYNLLSAARDASGNLPSLGNYFHLTANSSLIYTGTYLVDVSLDAEGTPWHIPPSLGAYEYDINSSNNTYYVKTNGSDNYSGISDESAWQSISKVNSYMPNFKGGDYILFKKDCSFYGTLNITKSGSANLPITFSSYGAGVQPIITGFTDISTWTQYDTSIYFKSIVLDISSYIIVNVNGVNVPLGRWPNTYYNTIDNHTGSTSISDTSLNSAVINWAGGEVVIRTADYIIERRNILTHNSSTLTFAATYTAPTDGYGYFIQNHIKTIDRLYEWCYNASESKFYMWFGTTNPSNCIVKVSSLTIGVSINSNDYLTFKDLNFTGFGKDGFSLVDSSGITIQDCSISFCGENAINGFDELGGISGGCIISNNTINKANDNGINLESQFINSTISYNTIYDIGLIPGAPHNDTFGNGYRGISLDHHHTNTQEIVEYNTLNNIGYLGIGVYGTNIFIRYNFISNICLIKQDGGGIYTYSELDDTNASSAIYIGHNIVINASGNVAGLSTGKALNANCIYVDGFSKGVTVEYNTAAYGHPSSFFCNGNRDGSVHNNTFFSGFWNMYASSFWRGINVHQNMKITNNIDFVIGPFDYSFLYTGFGDLSPTAIIDYNYYARPIANSLSFYYWETSTGSQHYWNFAQWQASTNQDTHSYASPVRCSSTSDIHFIYNVSTGITKHYLLDVSMADVTNTVYGPGSIDLSSWTSLILIGAGTVTEYDASITSAFHYIRLPNNQLLSVLGKYLMV